MADLEKRIARLEKIAEGRRGAGRGKPVTGSLMTIRKGDIVLLKGPKDLDLETLSVIRYRLEKKMSELGMEAQVFVLPFGVDVKVMRKEGK